MSVCRIKIGDTVYFKDEWEHPMTVVGVKQSKCGRHLVKTVPKYECSEDKVQYHYSGLLEVYRYT